MSIPVEKRPKKLFVKAIRSREKEVAKKAETREAISIAEMIDEEDGDIATPKYEPDYKDGF